MDFESTRAPSVAPSKPNWMFLDMNCYFASVEQHLRPELRGRKVAVIPCASENTSVIAASFDAKKCGVKTGTRVSDARRLCPRIVFVKARPDVYVQVHHALLRSVDQCAPVHKVYSIDEWSVRLQGNEQKPEVAVTLGRRIKQQLLKDFSPWLTCSIGIAPSRLLAKIASDLKKPDGLVLLDPSELPGRLEHLSLNDLCGIGQGMVARLHAHGIENIGALWAISKQRAVEIWGSIQGAQWWAAFHGHDEPELSTRRRSMSHANVLDPKFRSEQGAHGMMIRLLCRLGARLRHEGYFARSMRVFLNHTRGGSWHDEAVLPCVQDTATLLEEFDKFWRRRRIFGRQIPIKVGVEVGGLVPETQVSGSLFREIEKLRSVSFTVDKINRRWGTAAIYFGSMQEFRHVMDDKIAFGRIPPEVK